MGFNTASGRCCCNMGQKFMLICAESTRFNTASGRCCCNQTAMLYVYTKTLQSCFNTASGRCCCNLLDDLRKTPWYKKWFSFNTASGRCCCNMTAKSHMLLCSKVSIPQAVGAVATILGFAVYIELCMVGFNTASGRCCCNLINP